MDTTSSAIQFPFPDAPLEGAAAEVAPGILWMRLPLPMKLDHVNVYALDDGDSWTIVDTGIDSSRSRAIWQTLLTGLLKGKPVRRVVVTHHHPDHIGLAGWFMTEHGAELWTTRTAWLMARMLVLDEQESHTEEQVSFYRAAGMDADVLAKRLAERPFNFADVVSPLPLGFRRLQEGDAIVMGGREWSVHMGNGHAPEHATFWAQEGDLVLAGDQILPGISPNLGVYPTEPDADPVGEWLAACERFRGMAQPGHFVLPGHKLPFEGLRQRLSQLIDNHHGALARLEEFLEVPNVATACFVPLFKREIGGAEYGLALVEAVAHLNHLHQCNRVTREMREDGAWLWRVAAAR